MGPFFQRVSRRIRAVEPDWLLFAELDPGEGLAHGFPKDTPRGTVNASHWYDIVTLGTKQFDFPTWVNPWSGRKLEGADAIEEQYTKQLGFIKENARTLNDGQGAPTLIGEFGIPFDLDQAAAYKAWAAGDRSGKPWEKHVIAFDLMYNAMDKLLISSTHWNYTASNRNDQAVGDGWNQEDLSIYSIDQRADRNDINSGGRALEGFVRPYPRSIAGRPLKVKFKRETGLFRFVYEAFGDGETEIFVPRLAIPERLQRRSRRRQSHPRRCQPIAPHRRRHAGQGRRHGDASLNRRARFKFCCHPGLVPGSRSGKLQASGRPPA